MVRAALPAALLTIVFYGGVIVAIGVLVGMTVHNLLFGGRHVLQAPLLGTAIALGTAAWPRRLTTRPRGTRVTPLVQPRLFAVIRSIATAAGEAMPQDVFVDTDMNAAVSHWGGRLGLLQRRVLVVGMPLLQLLTVAEFAAVVAHEFGHFAGGHTGIAAWAYRVRASIASVGKQYPRLNFLFQAYGRMFLRVTRTLSRQQEIEADRFAARLMGSGPLASALAKVGPGATALAAYLRHDYLPVVQAGRRPPLLAGFEQFLRTRGRRDRAGLRSVATPAAVDPYDSHPPLELRLALLAEAPTEGTVRWPDATASAADLLDAVPSLEAAVLDQGVRIGKAPLLDVTWDAVGQDVWLPRLREARLLLASVGADDITLRDIATLGPRLRQIAQSLIEHGKTAGHRGSDPVALATAVVGDAALAALADAGWQVHWVIGTGCVARSGGTTLSPLRAVAGQIHAGAWQANCDASGLGELLVASSRAMLPAEPFADVGDDADADSAANARRRRALRRPRPSVGRRALANLVGDKTGWRALAVSVAAIAFVALGVATAFWLTRPGPPDLQAWRGHAAAFRSAWNQGSLQAVEQECRSDRRQQITGCIRRAMRQWGWRDGLPTLPEARDPVDPTHDTLRADFDLPGCELQTYWAHANGRWWLADVTFR